MSSQVVVCSKKVPGPKRGEVVRQIGQALRDNLDDLGRLVRRDDKSFGE